MVATDISQGSPFREGGAMYFGTPIFFCPGLKFTIAPMDDALRVPIKIYYFL